MTWWQLSLNCQASELEQIEILLQENGALSLSLRDAGDQPIYEPLPGDSPIWRESIVTATFADDIDIETLSQQLSVALPDHLANGLRRHQLQNQDWEQAYKQHLKPIQCAADLWIVPTWMDPPEPDATIIRLDPGMAFGTGGHATTSLCLAWLARASLQGQKIIDYGCGSGILAIAAVKLGAEQVIAVDIDPQAVTACESNRDINQISEAQIKSCLPNALVDFRCDLLIANILARPLIEFAPRFASLVRENGQILLSGILKTQLNEIQSAYRPRFKLDAPCYNGDWISISGTRTREKNV